MRTGERSAFPKTSQFGFREAVMAAKKKAAQLRPDVAETAFTIFQEVIGEAPKTFPPNERIEKNPTP